MMRFVFKFVFWGFIGLMILPSLVESPVEESVDQAAQISNNSTSPQPNFTTSDALQTAAGIAGYLKNICSHDPQLCENGARLVGAAVKRAQKGALVVADMVETHRAEQQQTSDPTTTSSIK